MLDGLALDILMLVGVICFCTFTLSTALLFCTMAWDTWMMRKRRQP